MGSFRPQEEHEHDEGEKEKTQLDHDHHRDGGGKTEGAAVHVLDFETKDVYDEGESGVDPVYQAKARILNDALQEIGMGRYQVRLTHLLAMSVGSCEGGGGADVRGY